MPGRWHSKGHPIVYTSETSPLAMLETMVHLEVKNIPPSFQLIRIEVPDTLRIETFPDSVAPAKMANSMAWGDAWLSDARTPLANVPAAVAPFARNWLINPLHPDAAAIQVTGQSRWPWDKRLFR